MDKEKLQQTLKTIMANTKSRILQRICDEPEQREQDLAALDSLKYVQREINIYLENME